MKIDINEAVDVLRKVELLKKAMQRQPVKEEEEE